MAIKMQVLVIDDGIERIDFGSQSIVVNQLHPEKVKLSDVEAADVLVVDFVLNGDWQERDDSPPARSPIDGLAVAQLLRRQTLTMEGPPKPIVVLTGEPEKLALPLGPTERRHVLAYANNLEWVFVKEKLADVAPRLLSLSSAAKSLPDPWPSDPMECMESVLRMDGLSMECLTDVLRANPPLHAISVLSRGLAMIRWMVHRVLPYPCFLIDSFNLALYLGIEPQSFEHVLTTNGFGGFLSSAEYKGILNDFLGQRWWLSSIRQKLQEVGADDMPARREELLKHASGEELSALGGVDVPVPCLGEDLIPTGDHILKASGKKLRLDDWPFFAEDPYTSPALMSNSAFLKSIAAG